MTNENLGLAIALARIEREASERTGFLDLGRLRLTALPDVPFRLKHLRELNLGSTPGRKMAKLPASKLCSCLNRGPDRALAAG